VGYTLIWSTVYFGFFESFKNWAKIGAAEPAPLLKNLLAIVSNFSASRRGCCSHIEQRKEVDMPRCQDFLEFSFRVRLSLCTSFKEYTLFRKLDLLVLSLASCFKLFPNAYLFGEIPCPRYFWYIGKDEKTRNRNRQWNYSIDNEKPGGVSNPERPILSILKVLPLPTLQSPFATKVIHSSHQVSREHGAKGTAGMKNAGSLCKLVSPIPGANHILHSRVEGTFGQADEETQDVNLGCGIAAGQAHCEYCPSDLTCGNPYRRSNASQQDVARDFSNHISHCPSSCHVIELVSV